MTHSYRNVKQSILEENPLNGKGETMSGNLNNYVESIPVLLNSEGTVCCYPELRHYSFE